MHVITGIIAVFLFFLSLGAHIYVRVCLRPKDEDESELDDCYWEFEEQHPGYKRYLKWLKLTFAVICLSVLLGFLTLVI